jgi:hypothetical protein
MSAAAKPFRRTHRRSQSSVDVLQVCGVVASLGPATPYQPPTCPKTPPNEPRSLVVIRSNDAPSFLQKDALYVDKAELPVSVYGAYAAAVEARNRSPSPPRRMLGYAPAGVGMARRLTF